MILTEYRATGFVVLVGYPVPILESVIVLGSEMVDR